MKDQQWRFGQNLPLRVYFLLKLLLIWRYLPNIQKYLFITKSKRRADSVPSCPFKPFDKLGFPTAVANYSQGDALIQGWREFEAYNIIEMGNISCCEQPKAKNEGEVVPSGKRRLRFSDPLDTTRTPNPDENAQALNSPASAFSIKLQRTPSGHSATRGPELYQSRKYLGRGAFGCVVLAEEKESGRLFAMKIIEKAKIREFNVMQCELMKRIGRQEFLVGIRETFQNQTHVYIVMEYLPMGELYYYLRKKEIPFPEALIRGVVAEIVVGISILHKFGVVYRELKPQNLLVTEKGHIKLTDYGLSKVIIEDKQSVSTFVGSLEYMPPEALEGDGEFGQKGDFWALGVLMFELHFRESPFGDEWRESIPAEDYKRALESNVLNERINAKIGYMSAGFRDLLLRLLEKDPEQRISLEEVRTHEFFKDLDWPAVQTRRNIPPLKEMIEKHDSITFRDATNEEYKRQKIAKHKARDDYEIRLYEFSRNSQ